MNIIPVANLRTPTRPSAATHLLLMKPPYFTPLTPPLSLASLKAFLAGHGIRATCVDYNTDPDLWRMHHRYFAALCGKRASTTNDGYSALWWILNAHMLSYANGADDAGCRRVLECVAPLYGISIAPEVFPTLLSLVETFYRRLDEFTRALDLSRYTMVGTSTYTTSLGPSLHILRRVKEHDPTITTIMGGGVFADDLALGSYNLAQLEQHYPQVDHIVVGEGERLLLALVDGRLAGRRLISLGDLGDGTIDLKEAPAPDFSDFDATQYQYLSVEGARSCPFQCSFCSETVQWGAYRRKPHQLLARQVAELARRHGNNAFFMGDSLMNPYLNAFASELVKQRIAISYDGYLRADRPVTNPEFAKLWAESGLRRARLGIESAATRVLEAMDKETNPATIGNALKTLARAGIRTTTYWVVGFPGETEDDFQETCEFVREHHRWIYELEAHPFYYYPYGQVGSRLYTSHPLYPEEVTSVTRFKTWEVSDRTPAREERFDRLRRMSALAASLGIPNIYTMADQAAAEQRWRALPRGRDGDLVVAV